MTDNIELPENEDLRIKSYIAHGWVKLPQELKDHFNENRFGVFDVIPPIFSWEKIDNSLTLTFKWGTDLNNPEIPLNNDGKPEYCWIPSLRSEKYIHPPRDMNKFVRANYPGLCVQMQPEHDWSDNNDVITLYLSWDLSKYVAPKGL